MNTERSAAGKSPDRAGDIASPGQRGRDRTGFAKPGRAASAQRKIDHLNRLYVALSRVNQTVLRSDVERKELLDTICRELATHPNFRLVWIGEHDERRRRVTPVAWAGPDQGFLDGLEVFTDERADTREPTGCAIRQGRGVVLNNLRTSLTKDPWCDRLRKYNFGSCAAYPLRLEGNVWGSVTAFASKPGFFRDREVALLEAVAGSISFAIEQRENKSKRRQLETHNQHLATIVESSEEAIASRTMGGIITSWNRGAEKIYGYTASEAIGASIYPLLVPPGREREIEEINDRLRRGEASHLAETVRLRKDGREIYVAVAVSPLLDREGRVVGAATVARDITARRLVVEALRASEFRYRSLFESMTEGLAFCRMIFADGAPQDFIYLAVNEAFEKLTGLRDIVGKRVTEAIPGIREADPELFERYGRVAQTGRPERFEVFVNALKMWFYISVYSPAKEHFVAVFDVITERKRIEETLRLKSAALEAAANSILITDRDGLIWSVNPAFTAMTGYTAEEAIGKNPRELVKSGRHDAKFYRNLWETVLAGQVWRGEIINRRKDGSTYPEEMTVTPVRNEKAETTHFIAIKQDITERKLLEEKLLHAQRLESLGMLAAGIAHDLNNVLAPIMFAPPMLRESLSSARDLKVLQTLELSATRGAGLVKQILGFAHGIAGELQPTQVKHLVEDIISVIEETFPKSIQVERQIPSGLWLAQSNPTQIHQVLLNLCINARDAMPRGGTLSITASNRRLGPEDAAAIPGSRPGAWLVLEVADTGTGIPPEILAHIWEPFYTTKGVGKGTGLGLSTVRGIVVNHNGFIDLRTEVGRGTTFRVFLPAMEGELPAPSNRSPFDVPNGQNELILVVDDDRSIRDLVSAILTKHGYGVVSCGDGVEAITAFTAHQGRFSLVLTDVDMPRLGGLELAQALLHLHPDVRLLAMSGLSRGDPEGADIPAAMKLARDFLHKPFKPEDLLNAVHRQIHPPEKS
jgi:PAS domain S-box-containing protein